LESADRNSAAEEALQCSIPSLFKSQARIFWGAKALDYENVTGIRKEEERHQAGRPSADRVFEDYLDLDG